MNEGDTTRLKQLIVFLYRRLKNTRQTHDHGDFSNAWDFFEHDGQFYKLEDGHAVKAEIEQIAKEAN